VACIIYAVKCTTFFRLTKENLKIKKAILYKCLQLGIPVALQNALIAVSLIVLQGVVNGFGATFTTAFNTNYNGLFSAMVVIILPPVILYCVFSKFFIEALSGGAVKG
jgi:Na+-driven multidrug efflux pump